MRVFVCYMVCLVCYVAASCPVGLLVISSDFNAYVIYLTEVYVGVNKLYGRV